MTKTGGTEMGSVLICRLRSGCVDPGGLAVRFPEFLSAEVSRWRLRRPPDRLAGCRV